MRKKARTPADRPLATASRAYFTVKDAEGGSAGYGGPSVPINSRYCTDEQEHLDRLPLELARAILEARPGTSGAIGRYSWVKETK